jgi:hypothetical protein
MSMSDLIKININFMKMKRHMLIVFFSYPCWWVEKWSMVVKKMEVAIRK